VYVVAASPCSQEKTKETETAEKKGQRQRKHTHAQFTRKHQRQREREREASGRGSTHLNFKKHGSPACRFFAGSFIVLESARGSLAGRETVPDMADQRIRR